MEPNPTDPSGIRVTQRNNIPFLPEEVPKQPKSLLQKDIHNSSLVIGHVTLIGEQGTTTIEMTKDTPASSVIQDTEETPSKCPPVIFNQLRRLSKQISTVFSFGTLHKLL